jgi:hypothetical protein
LNIASIQQPESRIKKMAASQRKQPFSKFLQLLAYANLATTFLNLFEAS